ncbi:MAG: T9SS type A sorting domain-containing protein [Bacteroidetes bacterium]|jgi:hypothetical protein|nr:T9SS type A sorting domain-containing protein [Bacteroidota bacterium]
MKRTDALWARTVPPGTITINGVLNEAAWAVAESVVVRYSPLNSEVIPGSGWKPERSGSTWNGIVTDPTYAVAKFLVQGNELIMGLFVRDSSVGGGLFNEADAVLINLRNHAPGTTPAGPFEYGYGWITESWGDPNAGNPGASPIYFGPAAADRTVWSGVTTVHGRSSDDKNGTAVLTPDAGYTMEIRFDLTPRGYDVTKPSGDIVEFSFSIYDADWTWPYNDARYYGNRAWWQGQWGNSDGWNVGRIYARADVNLSTAPLPLVAPDLVIPNGSNYGAPDVDGALREPVWRNAPGFRIAFGDTMLRRSYPGVAPWRSGQHQPKLSGATGTPPVMDSAKADVKYFFVGDTLFLAVDVQDWFVTSMTDYDRWDGIRFTINSRDSLETIDHALLVRLLDVRFNVTGQIIKAGYLRFLDSLGLARAAVRMRTGTTINDPNDVDSGYTVELAINLRAFGYPAGLGDRALFLGATVFDHDAFLNPSDDYGTRTWFTREHDRGSAPAWCNLDGSTMVTGVAGDAAETPGSFHLQGNFPNPFNPSTVIAFTLPLTADVTLQVIDLLGRTVHTAILGQLSAGRQEVRLEASGWSSGIYLYRLSAIDRATGRLAGAAHGKLVLMK